MSEVAVIAASQSLGPSLILGDVHLWLLPDDAADIEKMRADGAGLLSPDERQRHNGMRHEAAADRFLLGRILLRRVLAKYLGENPASLAFRYNANGKPELSGPLASQLSFNLSHSGFEIVLAVTNAPAIGVDMVALDRADAVHRISQRFFSKREIRDLELLGSEAPQRALMLWALKESVVKANGDSVWDGLAKISIAIEGHRIKWTSFEKGVSPIWQLAAGAFRDHYMLALAIGSSIGPIGKPPVCRTYRLGNNTVEKYGFEPEFL